LRSQTLSRKLGVELVEICERGARVWRYIISSLRTVAVIRRKQPDAVIATNPSIVLGYFLLVLRPWLGFKLVSDAHYFGVRAASGRPMLQRLLDVHNWKADLVIVTNESHARLVRSHGARTYVCQDPLPQLPLPAPPVDLEAARSVFLICSFDEDEPYEAAFMAFSSLQDQGYVLFVSGDFTKAKVDVSRFPWVRFLGFLPLHQYYGYLRSCSLVVDLTTMDDCLVCGAYEALAVRKPLVVSNTNALREYFGAAVMLTDNTPAAIRESVQVAYAQRHELARQAENWVASNQDYMNQRIAGLRVEISSLFKQCK
ncbi:MAG: glycosyltransferase, partial [Gammaproteobacteria bacterium]|nr:glycosyltransferase [Gammaproteobacteria bacterium]